MSPCFNAAFDSGCKAAAGVYSGKNVTLIVDASHSGKPFEDGAIDKLRDAVGDTASVKYTSQTARPGAERGTITLEPKDGKLGELANALVGQGYVDTGFAASMHQAAAQGPSELGAVSLGRVETVAFTRGEARGGNDQGRTL